MYLYLMPYSSPRNDAKYLYNFDIREIVQVKATKLYTEIQARTLCDGMPCYLTDLGEYWQNELRSLRGKSDSEDD